MNEQQLVNLREQIATARRKAMEARADIEAAKRAGLMEAVAADEATLKQLETVIAKLELVYGK